MRNQSFRLSIHSPTSISPAYVMVSHAESSTRVLAIISISTSRPRVIHLFPSITCYHTAPNFRTRRSISKRADRNLVWSSLKSSTLILELLESFRSHYSRFRMVMVAFENYLHQQSKSIFTVRNRLSDSPRLEGQSLLKETRRRHLYA